MHLSRMLGTDRTCDTVVTEHSLLQQKVCHDRENSVSTKSLCRARRVAWSLAHGCVACAMTPHAVRGSVATWTLCHDREPKVSVAIETLSRQRTKILYHDREAKMGSSPLFLFFSALSIVFMHFLLSYCLYKIYTDSKRSGKC